MSNIIRQWNGRTIRQREDGYLSATDMCQACGRLFADWMRLKSTTDYLQALESDMGYPMSQLIEVKKGNSAKFKQGTWIHPEVAKSLVRWLLSRKNTPSEKEYRDNLSSQLNGQSEVPTIAGNIDVLTSTELIEVKSVKQWKAALGQVLAYSTFYPCHTKRIHLYGETQESYLLMIESIAIAYGVLVSWEP